jgi:hypothetical protein
VVLNRARINPSPTRRALPGGGIPAVLLTDTIMVEPYRDVDTWDEAYELRCLVDAAPQNLLTDENALKNRTVRVFAPLGSDIPEGSKVTLPDATVGVAQAVTPRGATAVFPVPRHLDITVNTGVAATTEIGAASVVIVHRDVIGQDRYGNDMWVETSETVRGVAVGEISSSDPNDPDNWRVQRHRTVVFPPGTRITSNDRLIIDGVRWSIDGEPTVVERDLLGVRAGVIVRAVRTTG